MDHRKAVGAGVRLRLYRACETLALMMAAGTLVGGCGKGNTTVCGR